MFFVVVEDLQLGLLRRRAALDGQLLDVVARPLAFLPRLVVEPSVDRGWRARQPHRAVDPRRVHAAEGIGRLLIAGPQDGHGCGDGDDCKEDP